MASVLEHLRVAIVHYWLLRRRGGEQVLEVLAEMFPQADLFTLVMDPDAIWEPLRGRQIRTSFLQRVPGIRRHYQKFLPLCPLALETFDFGEYDLVISSESGPAKGVLTGGHTCHVCYCHTPMRYLWDMYFDYRQGVSGGVLGRTFYSLVSHYLRLWDVSTAARVDHFVANSENVAKRIWKTYRRSAEVIYPPVAVEDYSLAEQAEDFYLVVSQLVAYKRIDLAIAACNRIGRKLVVIGEGEQFERLCRMAGPTVTMLGWQDQSIVRDYYRRCRALLFPGEEDFGMTAVEVQASGRPVIALGRGGVLESVAGYFWGEQPTCAYPTGVFFADPSMESLTAAILDFEQHQTQFHPIKIKEHVQHFNRERFKSAMARFLTDKLERFHATQHQDREPNLVAEDISSPA